MLQIGPEAIDLQALHAVVAVGDGGIALFTGVVRDRADDGGAVVGIWYEAHENMALREFETIAQEARDRYGDVRIAIAHRTGELVVGDVAVAVLAASQHRAPAFDACRYCIDELKRRAPIWKKERYAGGSSVWRTNAQHG